MLKLVDGEIKRVDEPALTAINMRLRDDYTADCQRGLDRWNKIIERTGVELQARAAARGVPPADRRVQGRRGVARPASCSTRPTWNKDKDKWLPSKDDGDFIQSLMKPGRRARQVRRAGSRRPRVGIDNKPGDFEYVKIAA